MSCAEQTNIVITPGPQGAPGTNGTNGTNGVNAFTTTTVGFTMPAVSATVSVSVASTAWVSAGQVLFVETAGYFTVSGVTDSTTVVLTNLGYTGNASPSTVLGTGIQVSAAGVKGSDGSTTGTAGGDLTGTYPSPELATKPTLKGQLLSHNGVAMANQGVGTDGQVLHARSSTGNGLEYAALDVTGTNTLLTGALPLANGGTGQTSNTAAFNALSPTTTEGDVIVADASGDPVRLARGTSGKVLTAGASTVAWETPAAASSSTKYEYINTSGVAHVLTQTPGAQDVGVVLYIDPSGGLTVTLPSAADYSTPTSSKTLTIINPSGIRSVSLQPTSADSGGYGILAKGGSAVSSIGGSPSTVYEAVTFRAVYDGSTTYMWIEENRN